MNTTNHTSPSGEELKPCPFCGSAAEVQHSYQWWIQCSNEECGATQAHAPMDRKGAADAWNRRVDASGEDAANGAMGDRANLETITKLRTFLDTAAGEGFVLSGVDAADLFMAIFDGDDKVSDRLFSDEVRAIAFQELFEFQEATGYDTADEYRAALTAEKVAAEPVRFQTPISISTEKICEIAGKYNLGNPRLDALRGFVNEVIIVNGAEYAKSE